MSRSNKSKIAVTLLSALAFGANETSAMNSGVKDPRIVSASKSSFSGSKDTKLGSRNERIEKGVSVLKRGKILMGLGITLGVVEAANETAAGVMWAKGKESDSTFKGEHSVTNFIRSKIKKDDEQPGPGGKNPKKFGPEMKEEIVNQNEIKQHNMQKIDEALDACALKEKNFDKNAMKQKILQAFEKFNGIDLSKFSNINCDDDLVAYKGKSLPEGLKKFKQICNNQLKIFSAKFESGQLFICYGNNIGYELDFVDSTVKVYCYGIDEDSSGCVNGLPGVDIYSEELLGAVN